MYNTTNGRSANTLAWKPIAAGTVISASGNGDAFECGEYTTARLSLVLTSPTGNSPTIVFTAQTAPTADGSWVTLGTTGTLTQAGTTRLNAGGADRFVRLAWTLGGTGGPSFTVAADGDDCEMA